jgi:hypothetical protein
MLAAIDRCLTFIPLERTNALGEFPNHRFDAADPPAVPWVSNLPLFRGRSSDVRRIDFLYIQL